MTAAPRVLVVSHLFPIPENPALGCFVHEQVRALRCQEGIDARVVSFVPEWMSSRKPWNLANAYCFEYLAAFRELHWQDHEGVPVVFLPYLVGGVFGFWLHGSSCRAALRRAAPWLRTTFPFDLIHCHTSYPDGPAALNLALRRGVPLVLTEHTNPFSSLLDNWLMRRQVVESLSHAAPVWCVSSALADDVRACLPTVAHGRVEVLANGVDLTAFQPQARRMANRASPRLLSVTALEPYKNPLLLLRAFRRLTDAVPGARLALVGAGPLEDEARAYVQQNNMTGRVQLLGRLPRSEIARLLRDECDLFALSSDSETFGVVLIEALASGKPVVCTDCGGPRDIITSPEIGRLCPVGDDKALADALLKTIQLLPTFDPARLRRHAERFALSTLAGRLAQEYRGLLWRRAAA
jgi:glycosyltransferase involved in cell wall biosynthesis